MKVLGRDKKGGFYATHPTQLGLFHFVYYDRLGSLQDLGIYEMEVIVLSYEALIKER